MRRGRFVRHEARELRRSELVSVGSTASWPRCHDGTADARTLRGRSPPSWLVARKDLAIEFRTRTAFLSALVFALLGVTIFYFAWDATAVAAADLAPGVLWVIFTFAGAARAAALVRQRAGRPRDRRRCSARRSRARRSTSARRSRTSCSCAAFSPSTIPAVALFYNLPLGAGIVRAGRHRGARRRSGSSRWARCSARWR